MCLKDTAAVYRPCLAAQSLLLPSDEIKEKKRPMKKKKSNSAEKTISEDK